MSISQADSLAVVLSKQIDQLDLDKLARRTQFVRRQSRKINVKEFLLSLFVIMLVGSPSLTFWAQTLGLMIRHRLSKQAIHERIHSYLIQFLKEALGAALKLKAKISPTLLSELSLRFRRIFVNDATHIALPKTLAQYYPGSYSHTGKAATLKIQSVIDLLKEQFLSFDVMAFTDNDQKYSSSILEFL